MRKARLDVLLVERGLVESRAQAQRLIMAGQVRVNGQIVFKPAIQQNIESNLEIDQGPSYVSRGGDKLAAALQAFDVKVHGRVCADVGASTGGFTDCLLQHGATRVYAIDVGKGILHWRLRQDPRVVTMEATNARYVEQLSEPMGLVVIDVSFISLKILLPVVKGWLLPEQGEVIALIKPQFEVGRELAARGQGVIRDAHVHRSVLLDILDFAQTSGYIAKGLIKSPLLGPKGNVEFLAHLVFPGSTLNILEPLVDEAIYSNIE